MTLVILALYLIAGFGCAKFQRKMIYFPPAISVGQMEEIARADKLERWRGPNGQTLGWRRLCTNGASRGQVLIIHGNGCCAFQCGHYAEAIQQAASLDVYLLEYPGYGDCPGAPMEKALYASAREGFNALRTNTPICLVGESLGTGVAAYLCGLYSNRVSGVALLAPYTSLADVGQAHVKIFPVSWILTEHFPAEEHLRNYHGPVAILLAGRDNVVPARLGRRLYESYGARKKLWEFPEADHETLMDQTPEVWKEIVNFWGSSEGWVY